MFSVIMCSRDDARFAKAQAHFRTTFSSADFEIIRIADAKSMCEGYNRAVAQSRGDVLIFAHDDVELMAKDIPAKITRRLREFDVLGVAGTLRLNGVRWVQSGLPYAIGQAAHPDPQGNGYIIAIWAAPTRVVANIQALDGVWFCCKRAVVDAIPFDEQTFHGFHQYDLDFTFRAFHAGFKLAVCNDFYPIHASFGGFTDKDWQEEAERFVRKHAAALSKSPTRECSFGAIRAGTIEDVLEIMTPPWWRADDHAV